MHRDLLSKKGFVHGSYDGTSDSKPMSAASASAAVARLQQYRLHPSSNKIQYQDRNLFCIPVSLINAADNVHCANAGAPRWPNCNESHSPKSYYCIVEIVLWYESLKFFVDSLKLFFDLIWVLSFDWNYASKFPMRFPTRDPKNSMIFLRN